MTRERYLRLIAELEAATTAAAIDHIVAGIPKGHPRDALTESVLESAAMLRDAIMTGRRRAVRRAARTPGTEEEQIQRFIDWDETTLKVVRRPGNAG